TLSALRPAPRLQESAFLLRKTERLRVVKTGDVDAETMERSAELIGQLGPTELAGRDPTGRQESIRIAPELAADLRAEAVIVLRRPLCLSQCLETARQGSKIGCSRNRTKIDSIVQRRKAAGRDTAGFIDEKKVLSWSTVLDRDTLIQRAGANPVQIFFPA